MSSIIVYEACEYSSASSFKNKRRRKSFANERFSGITIKQQENKRIKVIDNYGDVKEFEVSYPKPRVVYSDIRRSYLTMFVNCMNSGDISLMYGFLDTFFLPDAYRIATKVFKDLNAKSTCEQFGIVEISRHWFSRLFMTPDMAVSVKDNKIVCYSNNESKLVANLNFKGTRLLDDPCNADTSCCRGINGCGVDHFFRQCHSNSSCTSKRDLNCKREVIADIRNSVDHFISTLAPRQEPLPIEADGEFTMSCDALGRISKMELNIVVDSTRRKVLL